MQSPTNLLKFFAGDGKPVTKTIVFIDKPLPPPKVNNYDKVLWYHKHALLASTVHRHQSGGVK